MLSKPSNANKIPIESSVGLELLEYPFVTLKKFPRGYIQRFGKFIFSFMAITFLK